MLCFVFVVSSLVFLCLFLPSFSLPFYSEAVNVSVSAYRVRQQNRRERNISVSIASVLCCLLEGIQTFWPVFYPSRYKCLARAFGATFMPVSFPSKQGHPFTRARLERGRAHAARLHALTDDTPIVLVGDINVDDSPPDAT